MTCLPKPEVLCGDLRPDTCVLFTGEVSICLFPGEPFCVDRQSQWNSLVQNKVCLLSTVIGAGPTTNCPAAGTGILGSIYLGCLTACSPNITPIGTTVREEFQNIYDILCDLKLDLNMPVPGIDPKCLSNPCDIPFTLGTLLQAIINTLCTACQCVSGECGCP